jgi:hypothetical protein
MAGHPFANCSNLQTPVKRKRKILSIKFKVRFFLLLLTIRKRSAEGKPGPEGCKSLQRLQMFAN